MWKSPNEKLQASENFWFSSISHLFNGENSRENAIQKAILSKGLCYFLFQSAQCHRNPQKPPLYLQMGFQNKQGRCPHVKPRILISKYNLKNSECETTSDRDFLLHFNCYTFAWEQFKERTQFKKAVRSKKLGCFFNQLYATEAHKDILWDYRRGSLTINVKKSEWEITS